MYYIRTAERLQRTARWQEELDGGLDHVRAVVCEDSLGIAEELEAAIAAHVDGYEDEWAATLRDPARLRRFRSFVNAPDTPDPSILRVRERDQTRPATSGERGDRTGPHRGREDPGGTGPCLQGGPAVNPTLDLGGSVVLVVGDPHPVRRIVRAGRGSRRVRLGAVGDRGRGHRCPGAPRPRDLAAGDHAHRDAIVASARAIGAMLATDAPVAPTPRGHVTLVGGGPGDPDLITIAGRRALADADVVLHDRLGPRAHVAELAPGAELIDVGKTPGHHAVPQHDIERLMLEHAGKGLRVVRLKGGDPFVFGRGGEEVLACRTAGCRSPSSRA